MGAFKYLAFGLAALVGVPLMMQLGLSGARGRAWLLTLLVLSTGVGKNTSINFMSVESYRGPNRGFEVQLTDLIALSLALVLVSRFSRRLSWLPFNSLVLGLYFGVAAFSVAQSPSPLYGLFTIWLLLRAGLIYWVIVNTLLIGTPLTGLWRGFVAEAMVLAFTSLYQKYGQGFYRVHGPFDHSNTIPLYANLFMPILLLWGLSDRRATRLRTAVTLASALGLVASVVFTFSRAGTALALLCLVGSVTVANLRVRSRRTRIFSAVMAVVMLGGLVKALPSFLDRMANAPESSEQARHEFNDAARLMAQDHSLGVGLNNFSLVLSNDERYREGIVVMANEEQAGVCHHIYWLTAAELGYGGLGLFVVIMLRFSLRALATGWSGRSLEHQLAWGVWFGLGALHCSGFLEWCFRVTCVTDMFVICCGLAVALGERSKR